MQDNISSEMPPEVIKTSDPYLLSLVGYIPFKEDKGIIGFNHVQLYEQPEKGSSVVADVQPGTKITVKDAMVYIYPRMSRIVITKSFTAKGGISHFPPRDVHFQKGDILYILCAGYWTTSVWYKGNFSNVWSNSFKIPYCIYPEPVDDSYGIYEGYINPLDKVPAREIQFKDNGMTIDKAVWLGGKMQNGKLLYYSGTLAAEWVDEENNPKVNQAVQRKWFFCRRNADIWLKVETEDNQIGWMLISEAKLGAAQNLATVYNIIDIKDEENYNGYMGAAYAATCEESILNKYFS